MWQTLLHKWLKVPYTLNAVEYQSPKHPTATIIMLHGIGSSHRLWKKTAKQLPPDVRIIAIDLLGFGASPKPHWQTYNVKVQADCVATTLFGMRAVGPIVLVGHSLGALVSVEFARRYRVMTKSLVLVSPPFYNPEEPSKHLAYKPDAILRKLYQIMATRPDDTERILRFAGKYNLINSGFTPENISVPAYLATLEAAIINQTSLQDALTIKRPMHIISGKLDPVVLDRNIKTIIDANSRASWTSVVGGHEIMGLMQSSVVKAVKRAIQEAQNKV